MAMDSSALRELARDLGVGTDYWGWDGNRRDVDDDTLRAVLAGLGTPVSGDEDIAAVRARRERSRWEETLPPVTVLRQDRESSVPVHVDHGEAGAGGRRGPRTRADRGLHTSLRARRPPARSGPLRAAGRPAPGLAPHRRRDRWSPPRGRRGRHPRPGDRPRGPGGSARLRVAGPAVLGAIATLLGHRRPGGHARSGRDLRCPAR